MVESIDKDRADVEQAARPGEMVVDADRVTVQVNREVYPLDAIYGASYVFIDRCFVLLDAPDSNHVMVQLRSRETLDEQGLRTLCGEFVNELLTQAWRQRVLEANRPIVQALANRAMAGVVGFAGLGELAQQFDADAFDDPLGIAVPWEEKYGKQPAAEATAEASDQVQSKGIEGP
jgi:His-Xaa-Ser system protein HxsD